MPHHPPPLSSKLSDQQNVSMSREGFPQSWCPLAKGEDAAEFWGCRKSFLVILKVTRARPSTLGNGAGGPNHLGWGAPKGPAQESPLTRPRLECMWLGSMVNTSTLGSEGKVQPPLSSAEDLVQVTCPSETQSTHYIVTQVTLTHLRGKSRRLRMKHCTWCWQLLLS